METIQCSKCGAVFERTGAKDKLRRFKDKRFMTTFHCPNCDARVILKNGEEPITLYLKRLERLKEQARRLGDRQEVNELQEEIDQINREIKMNAEKTKDKKFSVKERDKGHNPAEDANVLNAKMIVSVSKAKEMMLKMYPKAILYNISEEEINWKENGDLVGQYDVPTTTLYYRFKNSKDSYDPTKPKNIAAAKALSKAQGIAASDEEAYDPLDPENIAKEKELAKARGAAAADSKTKDAPSESERIKRDFEAGRKDHNGGYYDKWYRYNRSDNGKAYDEGFNSVAGKPVQIIEVMHDSKTKDSLFKGQKVTAIKSEQGLREGETYTVLGEDKIIKQIVGENDVTVLKLQDSSGNIVVIEDIGGLFYEVKDATSLQEEYAEKLFNKMWMDLTKSEKDEVLRHLEYDLNAPLKAKDAYDSGSEYAYDYGYEAAKNGKPISANPYKDVSRSGYADLKESWDDGWKEGNRSKAKDATNHMGERSFQTYEAWKRACKQINPNVIFEGDKDICQAKPGIGEWDGAEGIIYNTKTKDEVGIGRYKGFEMYQTGSNLFSATNYSSSIVPSASFSAPSIEELKNKIDQHIDRVGKGIMTGNYDDQEENEKLKVKIGDLRKNMDAAKKMGFDTAPYQKEIDKLETKDTVGDSKAKDSKVWAKIKMKDYEMISGQKLSQPGWYLVDGNDRPIDGPYSEAQAKKKAEKIGREAAYFSDYDIRNFSRDSKMKVKDEEKFPVGSIIRANIMGAGPEKVTKRDETTIWTNKGNIYHETKVRLYEGSSNVKDAGKQFNSLEAWQQQAKRSSYKIEHSGDYWYAYTERGGAAVGQFGVKENKGTLEIKANDSKTKDQNVYKSFEISMTSPGRFVAVSREGEKFEGNLSEVKKAVDDYWTRKEGKVSQSGWPKDSKAKDRKSKDSRDKLIERYKGVDVFFDHADSLYWAIPKGGVGLNGRSISEIHSKIDQFRDDQNAGDSKTKDGSLDEIIRNMAREKADVPHNDDGTIRTPQQAQLAYEQWYKIIKSRYKNDSRYSAEYGDSKTKDAVMKCMECGKKFKKNLTSSTFEVKCPNCGGYDVDVISGDSSDFYTKDPLTEKGKKILAAMKGTDAKDSNIDSKTKDKQQVIETYKDIDIIYDDVQGRYWAMYYGRVLSIKDIDISRLKRKIDDYLSGIKDSSDIYTKDPLTKKGTDAKDSLSYVTTYKGYEIAGSDKNIADKFLTTSKGYFLAASTLEELKRKIDQREKENSKDSSDVYTKDPLTKKGQKILEAMKKIYGEEKGEQIFYASRNKGTIENVDKNTSDSLSDMDKKQLALGKKFKIVLPSGMGESLYTNSFSEAVETSKEYGKGTPVVDLTKVTDSKTKDVELSVSELKNKALTKVLRDFYNGVKEVDSPATVAGAQKLTQMIQSETDPTKLKRWAGLDSKTKDQEIKIIIGEDPKVPNPAEQKVESNDVIYKEYTLKQLPETGEFEIYAPGGSIVGHAKALELAKLFVDRVVASKVSDAQSKDAMNESQVRSLCKQAGKEYLADNPDGDLDQVAGDIAEGIAYSNPQVLDFLKKEFGGSVTRRQAREYLADLI